MALEERRRGTCGLLLSFLPGLRRMEDVHVEDPLHLQHEGLVRALQVFELCKGLISHLQLESGEKTVPSTFRANSRTMPKSRRNPTCAWLMRAGIFKSPSELRRIVPVPVAPKGLLAAPAAAVTTG